MTLFCSRIRQDVFRLKLAKLTRRSGVRKAAALLLAAAPLSGAVWTARHAIAQIAVQNQGYVPFSEAPINYRSQPTIDPVAKLEKKLESGEVSLAWEPKNGYLRSVLQELDIPASSQTLVFSKTSFQYKKISPATPRATYFNDEVYIGYVNDGKALEVVSFDPSQGAIFYLLDARQREHPAFQRAELDCTQCHIAKGTRDVPGVLVRSIFPTERGTQAPQSSSFVTGQDTPLKNRWGGWYVTGSVGHQATMANAVVKDVAHPQTLEPLLAGKSADLSQAFHSEAYLTASSDVVAHLVLDHQTQMHNLITETNYDTRLALYDEAAAEKEKGLPAGALADSFRGKYEKPAEELLRYLLFANEAPLTDKVKGDSGFASYFASLGPRDRRGRSLREFDLRTRLFKYPCSYLIYSGSFDSLPEPAKGYLYHRLYEVLTGADTSSDFARLSAKDRKSIFEILVATKSGLPEEWRQQAAARRLAVLSSSGSKLGE